MTVTKVTGMMQTSTKGGDISSASPTVIDTDGDYFDLTGTTSFSVFTVTAGRRFTIQFDGILTMTHHATTLDLPGGANITTAAGDVAEFFATGTNTVQCVSYTKADGTAVVSSAGGNVRNFILDGDFLIWPIGTAAVTATDQTYNPALFGQYLSSTGTYTTEQSTTVPTFAESGWQSQFSLLLKCTGTDASPAVTEHNSVRYHITGSDFDALDQREVTISFWIKTASANTGHTYTMFLANSAFNRAYVSDFTATSSWTKITKTITLDTSGTWLKTDADKGLTIGICVQVGSNFQGTNNTWEGAVDLGTSSTSNFMDDTSNELYISQFQLVLGDSSPNFVGEPITTVKDQVDWYVQRYDYDTTADERIEEGHVDGTNNDAVFHFRKEMRGSPAVTTSAAGTFDVNDSLLVANGSAVSMSELTRHNFRLRITASATTSGEGIVIQRDGTDTCFIMAHARH